MHCRGKSSCETAGIALLSTRDPDICSILFSNILSRRFAGTSRETPTSPARSFFIAHDFDQTMLPAFNEQLAIQAKLNMLLGAEAYDALFLGFGAG